MLVPWTCPPLGFMTVVCGSGIVRLVATDVVTEVVNTPADVDMVKAFLAADLLGTRYSSSGRSSAQRE